MFQSFDTSADPSQGPDRLARLRSVMRDNGIDAYIVPRTDRFQGEYIAPADECLSWLTGFTGSAGFCVVQHDQAAIFVDSRYRVQVKQQVCDSFTPMDWPEQRLVPHLLETLPRPARVAYDPWLHTVKEVHALRNEFEPQRIRLLEADNLVHKIWPDRPAAPQAPVRPYPSALAGVSSADKRAALARKLGKSGLDALFVPLCDNVAWLFNLRGNDIPRVPIFHSYAIVYSYGSADLIVDPHKLTDVPLDPDVRIVPLDRVEAHLKALTGTMRLDPSITPNQVEILLRAGGAQIDHGTDFITLEKACKSPAEISATKTAHDMDACAMIEFLAQFAQQDPTQLTEIDVVRQLENARRATGKLQDISFDTISGSGPNAAIVHYRVTQHSNRALKKGEFLLIDSGGQYIEGTTDITRTVALGPVTPEMQELYTRVLQGMIRVSMLRFPQGTTGRDIDAFARASLWSQGHDYGHGTGHGVGAYLSVHEGPQRISKHSSIAFEPGMILSNEPGYYRDGAFGIRIENLILVQPHEFAKHSGPTFLSFDTLTYVPIDTGPIASGILSKTERMWLNDYHSACWTRYNGRVSPKARKWLAKVTQAI